jgi:heme A synthase
MTNIFISGILVFLALILLIRAWKDSDKTEGLTIFDVVCVPVQYVVGTILVILAIGLMLQKPVTKDSTYQAVITTNITYSTNFIQK